MDFPILIIWMLRFSFLGASGVFFLFLSHFTIKIMSANRIAPDGTPRFAASHLGPFSLPGRQAYMVKLEFTGYTGRELAYCWKSSISLIVRAIPGKRHGVE